MVSNLICKHDILCEPYSSVFSIKDFQAILMKSLTVNY